MSETTKLPTTGSTPVIPLASAPGEGQTWDRPKWVVYAWGAVELLLVHNPWQISSRLRVATLRAFGAEIESGVIMRPRTRVRFPWKLHIGKDSWIGEGVWFHNQDHIYVGHDVVISQETFLTTGSHAHRRDMALLTKPITIGHGSWVTSRSMILGGTSLGSNCLVRPMSVVRGRFDSNSVISGNPATTQGERFPA